MAFEEDEFCNKSLTDVINCTLEYSKHLMDDAELKPEAVAVPLIFALIFLVGVTGNVLLTLNFARHKKLSTPHNALVVNLAAGDLLMLFIGVPFNSVWYTFAFWKFGDFLCRLSRFAETLAAAVTIATLTALSVERYFIVTGRRRHHPFSSMPRMVIVFIWIVGFLLALPDFFSPQVVTPPPANGTNSTENESAEFCLDFNPDWGKTYPKANVMGKFLLLFCVPLLVIAPCYLALAFHLFFKMFGSRNAPTSKTPLRSSVVTPPVRAGGADDNIMANDVKVGQDQTAQNDLNSSGAIHINNVSNGRGRKTPTRKRRRLAVTVLGLVACFVLCWLPRHVFLLWYHFDPDLFNAFWHVFKITGFCLMFSNSAVNPFVFYVLDLHFRTFVHSAFLCRHSMNDHGNDNEGGGGENGTANPETMAVDMSVTEADRKTYIVMNEMPAAGERVDAL